MDPQPHQAVTRWLSSRAVQDLATSDVAQIDIDELFDEPPEFAAKAGLDCLQLALEQAHQTDADLDGILTIPLGASDELEMGVPSLSEVFGDQWVYGPGLEAVGLYLVRPRVWRFYQAGEEYRHTLVTDDLPPGYLAYYQCSRTAAAAASGWGYDRTIYIRTTNP